MSDEVAIKRVLISVSDKRGVVQLAQALAAKGAEILSTGGTAALLREQGVAVVEVSDYTGFPEMMDGRVKTLHPKVHGGLLARRDLASHTDAMQAHGIAPIDAVVIDLYPFEKALASGATAEDQLEQIDIGGPAMIRSAAKNHAAVAVVVDVADYDIIAGGITTLAQRRQLAAKAFARTAAYDTAVTRWLSRTSEPDGWPAYLLDGARAQTLRYGENPHQKAAFYTVPFASFGLATATQLQGKELSYNNLNDTDAAWQLVAECERPAVAIIKHANPCGVALGTNMADAYARALACDATSAYGGIIALNRELDAAFVQALGRLFAEVIIAPSISDAARAMLSAKKNLRVLITGGIARATPAEVKVKSVLGGYLAQTADAVVLDESALQVVSRRQPDTAMMDDLRFAFAVCKHVKSNAIVLVKGGATIGIGAGQMSRIDSVRIACRKAADAGLVTAGAVLASDAFFPFDDNVHQAAEAGIAGLIQPGGSVRDSEVIAAADTHDMVMMTTGMRHFNH